MTPTEVEKFRNQCRARLLAADWVGGPLTEIKIDLMVQKEIQRRVDIDRERNGAEAMSNHRGIIQRMAVPFRPDRHTYTATPALKAVKVALSVIERGTGYVTAPSYQGVGEQYPPAATTSRMSSHLDAESFASQHVASRPVVDPADLHCNERHKGAMVVFEGNEAQVAEYGRKMFAIAMLGDEKWDKWVSDDGKVESLVYEYLHGRLTFEELKNIKEPAIGPVDPDGNVPAFVDEYMHVNRPIAYKDYHEGKMVGASYIHMYLDLTTRPVLNANSDERWNKILYDENGRRQPEMGDG